MLYKLSGVILIVISLLISVNNFKKYSIIHNGKIVEVSIIDIPISCDISSTSLKAHFKFKYKNKIYTKNLKSKYCKTLKVNDIINLKTDNNNSAFVFLEEKLTKQYISIIVLFLIGILLIFKKG